ncbi:MAG TPA: hypothetical protein VFD05_02910 [Bacilli bacterium]|nr:hypothetical protein [Bacilli bacterium]
MKHKKTISGLMILVSLALAGCNFGSVSSSAASSSASDITTTTEVTSVNDDSSLPSSESGTSESSSEETIVDGHALRTVEDLELLRAHPEDDFHLLRNIDLGGIEWVPIPLFSGKFYGRDHKIKNLTIDESSHTMTGFFAVLDGAYIVDLTFENVEIAVHGPAEPVAKLENGAGVLAAMQMISLGSRATYIENVHVTKSGGRAVINMIDNETKPENRLEIAGGLIGVSGGPLTIHDSSVDIAINGAVVTGGLVGMLDGEHVVQISNSTVSGDYNGKMLVGGFVGLAIGSDYTIFSSTNNASLSAGGLDDPDMAFTGGFVGATIGGFLAIQNGLNTGFIGNVQRAFETELMGAGGFIGAALDGANVALTKVHNRGQIKINVGNNAGGLVAYVGDVNSLAIAKSRNSGGVKALNHAGGLIAMINDATNVTIANSYNEGSVTADDITNSGIGGISGGFVARIHEADITVSNSYNNAAIHTANSFAGGFFGYIFEGIATLTNVLHIGEITGTQDVGTFAGDTSYNLQITNSYYNASFVNRDGEVPDWINLQGAEVLLANLDSDFFNTTLGWDNTIWDLTNIDSTNLPTLI